MRKTIMAVAFLALAIVLIVAKFNGYHMHGLWYLVLALLAIGSFV